MVDLTPSFELELPADEVDAAIGRWYAAWGLDQEAVVVETEPADGGEAGRVRLRATRRAALAAMQSAQSILVELLDKMKVAAAVESGWSQPGADGERVMMLDIQGDDLGVLIGRRGETLAALQYLVRLIVTRQTEEGADLVVDVQGHKRRREEQLRRMARRMAEQAVERNRVMTLEPMPAAERRIVHLELRNNPQVHTESVGEGEHRKVTIIPNSA